NPSVADELIKLKQLMDAGMINQEEFEELKNKIINK
ncbi:MAG: SHOCT domain-containing protein, partial [Lachnospiraceae bacterium]|nr:SHOCT domain-containing protein [Lachnospiraceae bacterium]